MAGKVVMLFELPLKLVQVNTPEGLRTLVVIHEAGADFAGGLRPEQILGSLRNDSVHQGEIRADNFLSNRPFVEFLQAVIAARGSSVAGLAAAARAQGSGWVYVLDGRTPTPRDAVPPEDIFGGFAVIDGRLVAGSYQPNPQHRLVSERGLFRLDRAFGVALMEAIRAKR